VSVSKSKKVLKSAIRQLRWSKVQKQMRLR